MGTRRGRDGDATGRAHHARDAKAALTRSAKVRVRDAHLSRDGDVGHSDKMHVHGRDVT